MYFSEFGIVMYYVIENNILDIVYQIIQYFFFIFVNIFFLIFVYIVFVFVISEVLLKFFFDGYIFIKGEICKFFDKIFNKKSI